jgi:DNA repair protein SbcD/Mre11
MLTVFHTADWHLGQSFFGFDRDHEHARFLEWLLHQLQSRQPDALLIAGDVFDSINPSATAQRRYFSFLAQAHALLPNLQIVMTAGNHDAGARLEAPAGLMEVLNISVVGTVSRFNTGEIDLRKFLIPVKDRHDKVQAVVLAVPFLRPSDVPLIAGAADPYLDGIRELYRQTTEAALELKSAVCPEGALIAMGHCHVSGGEESKDSERRLVIGGAEAVTTDYFPQDLDYVALGHLHKAQHFRDGRIRYCGSPIPLSFAETSYRHEVIELVFNNHKPLEINHLQVPRSIDLLRIPEFGPEPLENILPVLQLLPGDSSGNPDDAPFLEVRVLEDQPDPRRRIRIEEALEGKSVRLVAIRPQNLIDTVQSNRVDPQFEHVDLKTISPEEIFLSTHLEKYGTAADESLLRAFREILLQEEHSR